MSVDGNRNVYGRRRRARACALACAVLAASAAMGAPPASAPTPASADPPAAEPPAAVPPRRPLDLRLGDLRRHVPAEQLYEPWTTDLDEVVIRPRRAPPDLPERRAVPQGLGGLFWAARNPAQSWRLFVPDPNADPDAPATRLRSPDDPQPPPGAFRSRIGEPGRIF